MSMLLKNKNDVPQFFFTVGLKVQHVQTCSPLIHNTRVIGANHKCNKNTFVTVWFAPYYFVSGRDMFGQIVKVLVSFLRLFSTFSSNHTIVIMTLNNHQIQIECFHIFACLRSLEQN